MGCKLKSLVQGKVLAPEALVVAEAEVGVKVVGCP